MKSLTSYPVKVFSTGFVVLTLLSIPLFWFRCLCQTSLVSRMSLETRYVSIRPSGLVPHELEDDPNVVRHSEVSVSMDTEEPLLLGIVDYFKARGPGGRQSNIYDVERDERWTYFDQTTGLIVCKYTDANPTPDRIFIQKVQRFAGPEGVSDTPDKNLGRFICPIIDSERKYPLRLYDKKLRRFFIIDFHKRTVFKGPQLSKDDKHNPIQIGRLSKNPSFVQMNWSDPHIKVSDEEREKGRYPQNPSTKKLPGTNYGRGVGSNLLVLDETGRIDLLDRETLEFVGTAGFLPNAQFSSTGSAKPVDLLGYSAFGLTSTTDNKYRGMCVASISREGTALTLAVFDEKGKRIRTEYTEAKVYIQDASGSRAKYIPSSKAVFFEAPWAPASTIGKYLVENLHPPLLNIVSFFMADSIEAAAGHRALFFLPNSFAAMKGRDISGNIVDRFFTALVIILPSTILAILLAWRVSKDATVVGFSENVKLCWLIGTIAFGLPAYITYRLARPKITLVTCANCGNPRRPDMDKCHRCGSTWRMPELTAPTWRIVDS